MYKICDVFVNCLVPEEDLFDKIFHGRVNPTQKQSFQVTNFTALTQRITYYLFDFISTYKRIPTSLYIINHYYPQDDELPEILVKVKD